MQQPITIQPYGDLNGRPVMEYTLVSETGLQVCIINYGASVTKLYVPQGNQLTNVVLGYDTLQEYINAPSIYMGAICGRYAGRIANASFRLNDAAHTLSKNIPNAILHGGYTGFDKVYWEATVLNEQSIQFSYESKDGEEGFPGNVSVRVLYEVKNNELHISYHAETDKATPINLTSHGYFNLSGGKEEDINHHLLQLFAQEVVEMSSELLPTGKINKVKNTDFDFSSPSLLEEKLKAQPGGFDSTWVISGDEKLKKAAELTHQFSPLKMTVFTTKPGIHFYSGQSIEGEKYPPFAGLCLEAQYFPDSPNQANFPNTILEPNQTFSEKTIYAFAIFNP